MENLQGLLNELLDRHGGAPSSSPEKIRVEANALARGILGRAGLSGKNVPPLTTVRKDLVISSANAPIVRNAKPKAAPAAEARKPSAELQKTKDSIRELSAALRRPNEMSVEELQAELRERTVKAKSQEKDTRSEDVRLFLEELQVIPTGQKRPVLPEKEKELPPPGPTESEKEAKLEAARTAIMLEEQAKRAQQEKRDVEMRAKGELFGAKRQWRQKLRVYKGWAQRYAALFLASTSVKKQSQLTLELSTLAALAVAFQKKMEEIQAAKAQLREELRVKTNAQADDFLHALRLKIALRGLQTIYKKRALEKKLEAEKSKIDAKVEQFLARQAERPQIQPQTQQKPRPQTQAQTTPRTKVLQRKQQPKQPAASQLQQSQQAQNPVVKSLIQARKVPELSAQDLAFQRAQQERERRRQEYKEQQKKIKEEQLRKAEADRTALEEAHAARLKQLQTMAATVLQERYRAYVFRLLMRRVSKLHDRQHVCAQEIQAKVALKRAFGAVLGAASREQATVRARIVIVRPVLERILASFTQRRFLRALGEEVSRTKESKKLVLSRVQQRTQANALRAFRSEFARREGQEIDRAAALQVQIYKKAAFHTLRANVAFSKAERARAQKIRNRATELATDLAETSYACVISKTLDDAFAALYDQKQPRPKLFFELEAKWALRQPTFAFQAVEDVIPYQ